MGKIVLLRRRTSGTEGWGRAKETKANHFPHRDVITFIGLFRFPCVVCTGPWRRIVNGPEWNVIKITRSCCRVCEDHVFKRFLWWVRKRKKKVIIVAFLSLWFILVFFRPNTRNLRNHRPTFPTFLSTAIRHRKRMVSKEVYTQESSHHRWWVFIFLSFK